MMTAVGDGDAYALSLAEDGGDADRAYYIHTPCHTAVANNTNASSKEHSHPSLAIQEKCEEKQNIAMIGIQATL